MSSDCMGFVCENCDNPSRQSTYFQHYDMAVLEIQKFLNTKRRKRQIISNYFLDLLT